MSGAGPSGGKKTRFVPNASAARARRSDAPGHAEQAMEVERDAAAPAGFEDLQKIGMDWESGKNGGRSRERVQGEGRPQQQVTFGANEVMAKKTAEPKTEGGTSKAVTSSKSTPSKPGSGKSSSSPAGGGGRAGVKQEPKIKEEDVEMKEEAKPLIHGTKAFKENKTFSLQDALDYNQYYPTTLPMGRPRVKKEEGEDLMDLDASAPDIKPDDENDRIEDDDNEERFDAGGRSFAEEIGLISRSGGAASTSGKDSSDWLLIQLPTILPLRRWSTSEPPPNKTSEHQRSKGEASTSRQAAEAVEDTSTEKEGSKIEDLPSGEIGQVLVYKSGKVKLKIGEVLMDMAQGLPVMHRMDVASLSAHGRGQLALGGQVVKRVVVTPDIQNLIQGEDLD